MPFQQLSSRNDNFQAGSFQKKVPVSTGPGRAWHQHRCARVVVLKHCAATLVGGAVESLYRGTVWHQVGSMWWDLMGCKGNLLLARYSSSPELVHSELGWKLEKVTVCLCGSCAEGFLKLILTRDSDQRKGKDWRSCGEGEDSPKPIEYCYKCLCYFGYQEYGTVAVIYCSYIGEHVTDGFTFIIHSYCQLTLQQISSRRPCLPQLGFDSSFKPRDHSTHLAVTILTKIT